MTKFNRRQEPDYDAEDQLEEEGDGKGGCGAGTIAIGMCLIGTMMFIFGLDLGWVFIAIGGIIFMIDMFISSMKLGL